VVAGFCVVGIGLLFVSFCAINKMRLENVYIDGGMAAVLLLLSVIRV